MIAEIVLGVIIAAAEPTGTLTLACQGNKTSLLQRSDRGLKETVSLGIIVDLPARTVSGFDDWREPIPITDLSETIVTFEYEGSYVALSHDRIRVNGRIARITGELNAFIDKSGLSMLYSLKCKPTQRMF
jgi:hypothetical protein